MRFVFSDSYREVITSRQKANEGPVLEAIVKKLKDGSQEKAERYSQIPSAVRLDEPRGYWPKPLLGADFSEMLRISGITKEELLASFPVAPTTTPEEQEFLERCARLPDSALQQLLSVAKFAIDPTWLDKDNTICSPSAILYFCFSSMRYDEVRELIDTKKYHDPTTNLLKVVWRQPYKRFKLEEIPDVARRLNISAHYFLLLDSDIHIYTDSDAAEELFDYYTLLPEWWKTVLFECADSFSTEAQNDIG